MFEFYCEDKFSGYSLACSGKWYLVSKGVGGLGL